MNILGINAYHGDASAALLQDGQLVAAIEEERFNRIKHWAGFPAQSIRFCLDVGGITAGDLEHIAISFNPRANLGRRLAFVAAQRPSPRAIWERFRRQTKTLGLKQQFAEATGLSASQSRAKLHRLEHHQTHVASGFLISPFHEAAVLSIDGMGDFTSTMTAHARGQDWSVLQRVYFPHSLGFLYTAITMYLGFPYYGDEYKVMGLAPYGQPEYIELFRDIIYSHGKTFRLNLDYFTHARHGISMTLRDGGNPHVDPFHSPLLEKMLGPPRDAKDAFSEKHENIAASLQAVSAEIILHLLKHLHDETQQENVVLVGGCAMNSVAIGKVTQNTAFKNAYVPVGAADNGTAIGAAAYVWHRVLGKPRRFVLNHAYWGDQFSDQECQAAIEASGLPFRTRNSQEMLDQVVEALVNGKIVGWCQGRMEFGARALGNRSLLADPRQADIRDIINAKIKFREKFRPFAPSILEEYVSDYFQIDEPSPFMERVLPIRPEKQAVIPAVTHVDGSGRLQTVSRNTNPLYWDLIERFRRKTGIPIILNTSLNENEPIVRTPEEAINCFLRTSMDILVLGRHIIDRTSPEFLSKESAAVASL